MNIEDCYPIGRVLRPHGLRGEVTLALDRLPPVPLESQEIVYISRGGELVPYFMTSISVKGAKAYVKFETVDSVEKAKAISTHRVYLPKSLRPQPDTGEFYDDEVAGFDVIDVSAGNIGTISGIMESGAQMLIVVTRKDKEKETLIPVNAPFIDKLDREKKELHVQLPDGFLEI